MSAFIRRNWLGFILGLSFAFAAIGLWALFTQSTNWKIMGLTHADWSTVVRASLFYQITVPAWAVALVVPGYCIVKAIEFVSRSVVARLQRFSRTQQLS